MIKINKNDLSPLTTLRPGKGIRFKFKDGYLHTIMLGEKYTIKTAINDAIQPMIGIITILTMIDFAWALLSGGSFLALTKMILLSGNFPLTGPIILILSFLAAPIIMANNSHSYLEISKDKVLIQHINKANNDGKAGLKIDVGSYKYYLRVLINGFLLKKVEVLELDINKTQMAFGFFDRDGFLSTVKFDDINRIDISVVEGYKKKGVKRKMYNMSTQLKFGAYKEETIKVLRIALNELNETTPLNINV